MNVSTNVSRVKLGHTLEVLPAAIRIEVDANARVLHDKMLEARKANFSTLMALEAVVALYSWLLDHPQSFRKVTR